MLVSNLILGNLPQTYNQERIKDFVEGTLDLDVKHVVTHHSLQGKAVVILCSEIEFETAVESLKDCPIEKQVVDVQETEEKPFTVIVQDVEPKYLSKEFLEIYFCAVFGDGEDIVISCQMIPNLKTAAVTFKTSIEVMRHILDKQDHEPLPSENFHILVEPYYTQFHDWLTLSQQSNESLKGFESFEGCPEEGNVSLDFNSSNKKHYEGLNQEEEIADNFGVCVPQNTNENDFEQVDEQEERADDHDHIIENRFDDFDENDLEGSHKFSIEKGLQSFSETRIVSSYRGYFRGRQRGNRNTQHHQVCTRHSGKKHNRNERETGTGTDKAGFASDKSNISSAPRGRGNARRKMFPGTNQQFKQNDYKSHGQIIDEEERTFFYGNQNEDASRESSNQERQTKVDKLFEQNFDLNFQMQSKITQEQSVGKAKLSFLKGCIGDFEKCTVRYNQEREVFVFEGTEEFVRLRHLMLLTEIKKIKEEVLELTPAMAEVLRSRWQQQCLANLNDLVKPKCQVSFENSSLKLLAHGEDNLKASFEIIKTEINGFHLIQIQENFEITDFQSMKFFCELKFAVILSQNGEGIVIEGIKEDVDRAKESINDKLHNLLTVTDTFEVVNPKVVYFNSVFLDNISSIIKDVETAVQTRSDKKISLTVTGTKPRVKKAMKNLENILSTIQSKSWDLNLEFRKMEDLKLVVDSLSKLPNYLIQFERNNHCSVSCKLSKTMPFPLPYSHKSKESISKKKYAKSQNTSASRARPKQPINGQQEPLVYTLSNTCQLVLQQSAKITQENSSALVCVLDRKADLTKTRVGQDFCGSCPTLQKQLREASESAPGMPVVVTKGPFQGLPPSCQAVYHAVLSKWTPGSSEAILAQVVQMLISNATSSGLTSISIPPLGYGRLLRFPPQSVAQITIQQLCSVVPKSSLKRVVLLADSQLIAHYKGEAQKALPLVASTPAKTVRDRSQEDEAESDKNPESDSSEGEVTDSSDDETLNNYNTERETDIQPQYKGLNSVTIWTHTEQGLDGLWAKLKKAIDAHSLHAQFFNQPDFRDWPKYFCQKILSQRNEKSVWIETCQNPKTKMASFMVKGEELAVEKMMDTIKWEHKIMLEKQPKRITSSKAKRGTLQFIEHAASCNEPIPSYWNVSKKDSDKPGFIEKFIKKIKGSRREEANFLVDVNQETKKAIEKLVEKDLFDPHLIGHGNDAIHLNHKGIKVIDVKRVENPVLFEPYNMNRNQLFQECCRRKQICKDIGTISGSKGRVQSTEHLPSFMKSELYWEINEHYLFHGSPTQYTNTLITSGADPRVGSEGGMFGKGFYLAEKTTKADQYADSKSNRQSVGKQLTMIMFRALLGNTYLCDDRHPSVQSKGATKLSRPPCLKCMADKCSCVPQHLFDSVMGDGKWLFREFVLYDRNLCYPEYVIHYKRV